jgi:hypothetical protein
MIGHWLPMNAAPKDGDYVLVSWRGKCEMARWDDDRYSKHPKPFWFIVGPWGKLTMRQYSPDGWMLLPEPIANYK